MAPLLESGRSWKDLYIQCVVGNIMVSYRNGLKYDPSYCESRPLNQEIEDQVEFLSNRH